jgi:hypothetical protein
MAAITAIMAMVIINSYVVKPEFFLINLNS